MLVLNTVLELGKVPQISGFLLFSFGKLEIVVSDVHSK